MFEILVIVQIIICLVIFSNFPLNFYYFKLIYQNYNLSYADSLLLNSLIVLNLFLILSFFKVNLSYLFIIILIISLSFVILRFVNFVNLFKRNIYISLIFLIIVFSMSSVIAKTGFLEWDGLGHWIFKAQVYYKGGEYKDLKSVPLNWYPHLGSYMWAFFWKNSVLEYEYFGRIFFIFIFVLSIFTLIPRLSNKFSIVKKLLIIFCIIYLSTNFYLLGGYQEYLIFFSFFIFSYFMLFFYKNKHLFKKNYIPEIIFLLIINIIIWTKQEGFFYFIILGFLFLLYGKRNINQKILFFVISSLLLIFFIFIKKYYFGQFQFNEKIINSELINNFDFFILFKKITLIVKYFFITFVKYPIWIVIFLCLFVLKYKYKLSYENKFYYAFLFLSFSFVFAIFLHTKMDLNFLIPVTLNRIVFAISGFYIVLIVDILNRLRK